jgi:hypothetical protein
VKRLRGWDAVLLYSETPTVHMHTLKLAVIELDDLGGRAVGIDEFQGHSQPALQARPGPRGLPRERSRCCDSSRRAGWRRSLSVSGQLCHA